MDETKILFLINGFGSGGAERQLTYLTRVLKERGYTPCIVTVFDSQHTPYHPTYIKALAEHDIPLASLSHGSGHAGRLGALWRYRQLMWTLRPHIVQGFMHYANLITRVMRPFCPPHHLLTSARSTYSAGEMRSERLTAWLDDGIITNNPDIQNNLVKQANRPPEKTHYIPNSIDLERFSLSAPSDKPAMKGDFIIGVIGRVMWKKDHLTLLQALNALDSGTRAGLHTFLLGNIDDRALYQQMTDYIRQQELSSLVSHVGAVDDVIPYYHAADITVLPSVEEGFPNVVLESLASGCPAIVSDMANKSGLVQHGVNGWVFPARDSQALAQCIRLARQQTPKQRETMRCNAVQSVQPFGIDAVTDQFLSLYNSLRER